MPSKPLSTILALALAAPAAAGSAGDIHWYEGTVEEAFAEAKETERPLFLYWGAVWCPPCNQIKKTIFTRREFAEKMKSFLPVYLDGDTESAQIWGERLEASGYPTMLVLSSDAEEVMRMPGGLQLEKFIEILDTSLQQMTPMSEVLEQALTERLGDDVPDASWQRIAFYSWGQDRTVDKTPTELEAAFRALEAKVPPRMADVKARLFSLWLDQAVSLARETGDDGEPQLVFTADDVRRIDRRLFELLSERSLTMATIDFLMYGGGATVEALHPKSSPERTALIAAWEKTMEWVETNDQLSVDERVSALLPTLEFHQLSHGEAELPKAFQERVRDRALWADRAAKDAYTRQASMSTAGWLLRQVGLNDDAKKLYLAQLDKAVSPHYFMSSLSIIARNAGDTDEAVSWLARAYDASEGPATRFQWGTSYLMGLMSLQPDDGTVIEKESRRVLSELLSHDDAFAGRNAARIGRLKKSFAGWNENGEHSAEVESIRKSLTPGCAELAFVREPGADDSMKERCSEFFTELGRSGDKVASK